MTADRWYYQRQGQTLGPVSTAEIKHLGESGSLQPNDLVWPEGVDCRMVFVAWASVGFSASRGASIFGLKTEPALASPCLTLTP